jgi:chromosome segregation ATPase
MAEDGEIPTLPEAEAAGGEPAPAAEPDVNAASGVDWESRANDLQAKVAEMTEELESVKSSFAQEEAETKRLTEEVAEKDKQIEQLSGDRDQDLGDMLDDLRRDLDQQNDDLEQLRRDLRDKEDEMRSEQDATRRAQEDLIRERENTERFQKDRQRDKQEIERLQGKISDMRGTADKLKRDQFKVKKQAEERNRKADQFLDEIAELTKRDKELQEKADEAVMQLNEVLAELEEVQEKFDTADADRKRMLQEMAGAESERADFESRIAEGEESYNALQDEMDAMAEDYQARLNEMTDAYEEAKDGLDKTSAENELLQNEIDQLKDESALGIVQTKLEQAEKEQEELRAANQDMDAELTEVIDERDTIKVELRELKRDAKKNLEDAVGEERGKTEDAKAELADVTQQLALTRKRYDTLDDTVADKDSEIFRIQTRMDEMEQAVWGLPEAVKEVKILTARVSTRDKELKETKALLNDRVRQLDDIRLETTELRRRLGKFTEAAGEDDEGQAAPLFDLKLLKLKEQAEMERLRALNEILTTENEQLEEERLELKTKLRFSASQRAQFALSMGLTSEQYSFLESVAERMREDGVPDMPLNDRSRDLEEQLQRRDDQIADLQERLGASDEYGDEVKESLEQMRNVIEGLFKENRELRSANLRFQPHSSVAGAAPAVGAPAQPPPAQIVYQQTTFAAAPSAAAAEPPATTPSKAAVAAAPLSVDIPAGKGAGDTTRSPTPEDDDDQQQEEETQQAGFSSGPGTPLQRQVLRILGDAGLRSSLGMQPAASGPQAHENQKLREANARLLENALESSASADTGALKARAEKVTTPRIYAEPGAEHGTLADFFWL